jgi:hypothetical protein
MARLSLANGRTSQIDLEFTSIERLADANVLDAGGRHASAIAHGLYALEIRLKSKICLLLDLTHLPRAFEVHELPDLLILAGLERKLNDPAQHRVKANWDAIVTSLAPHVNDLRYLPGHDVTAQQAKEFLDRLSNPLDGVLTWLST